MCGYSSGGGIGRLIRLHCLQTQQVDADEVRKALERAQEQAERRKAAERAQEQAERRIAAEQAQHTASKPLPPSAVGSNTHAEVVATADLATQSRQLAQAVAARRAGEAALQRRRLSVTTATDGEL